MLQSFINPVNDKYNQNNVHVMIIQFEALIFIRKANIYAAELLRTIFHSFKLELLTQFPAQNNEK